MATSQELLCFAATKECVDRRRSAERHAVHLGQADAADRWVLRGDPGVASVFRLHGELLVSAREVPRSAYEAVSCKMVFVSMYWRQACAIMPCVANNPT